MCVHRLLCVGLSSAADIWHCMGTCVPACGEQMWTPACECVCACVKGREGECVCVCVHMCVQQMSCVLLLRLAALCCCSLVQTGLATCFSVCEDKPRLRLYNLSIAAAKPRLSHDPQCDRHRPPPLLDDEVLLTHTYRALSLFRSPSLTPTHCLSVAASWTRFAICLSCTWFVAGWDFFLFRLPPQQSALCISA